jgi:hypothetical protein
MLAPHLPSIFLKVLFIAALVAVLSVQSASAQTNPAGSASAQKNPASPLPKYDLQSGPKFKGTVEELKLPPKGSEKVGRQKRH